MPKFTTVPADEMSVLRKRKAPKTDLIQPYIEFLKTVDQGGGGRAELETGETQRAIKRRITTAGKLMGLTVKYRTAPQGTLVFELQQPNGERRTRNRKTS